MSESIKELRQRWEEDPTPQLSLHLAEEYRRLKQPGEAAEVLTRALEEHPGHVAARVALGRFKSELGEVEEACGLLERVVNEDPTHLVASKLLVSLYLERGDRKLARDRLDLYKVLNESDPEIAILEARISHRPQSRELAEIAVDIPRNGDPFQDLWAGIDAVAHWRALGAEGIFPVSGGPPSPARPDTTVHVMAGQEASGATVTLANLYLQQGHLEDAEQAFEEVLSRDPMNPDAVAGMEEVRNQRGELLMASEGSEYAVTAEEGSVTARKIEVLKDYLRRIRVAGNQ